MSPTKVTNRIKFKWLIYWILVVYWKYCIDYLLELFRVARVAGE